MINGLNQTFKIIINNILNILAINTIEHLGKKLTFAEIYDIEQEHIHEIE